MSLRPTKLLTGRVSDRCSNSKREKIIDTQKGAGCNEKEFIFESFFVLINIAVMIQFKELVGLLKSKLKTTIKRTLRSLTCSSIKRMFCG